jgi:hypothetical protein
MRKTEVNLLTEARLIRAYLNLFLVSRGKDGSKTTTLARFGCYEVRLFELAHETLPLWMELCACDTGSTLDSFGCDDFEAAVPVADEFMAQAKTLHEESAQSRSSRGTGPITDHRCGTTRH